MSSINNIIRSIRDIMRKDSGVDGDAQRLSQMVWMLFMKIFSDKESEWKQNIKNYVNPIPIKMRWENWASENSNLDNDGLIFFVNHKLFPTLKKIDEKANRQSSIVKSVFEDTYNYMKNGNLFRQVISEINKIDFRGDSDRHVFNEIYENLLKELQSAGSSGEYYTPRPLTQFMVEMIDPKFRESILDPACGTGGFLTCSIEHISKSQKGFFTDTLQKKIVGIEKKPLPHLLCSTNLMLHGFNAPYVFRDNLLTKPFEKWMAKDQYDVILSNPPFGGIEENGTENNFPSIYRTKETADLFVVLIIKLLKKNGRAAVILPDGFLYGEGVRTKIKEYLLNECNLHTIVRLPKGVFNPYTGIKTNLLFFQKGTSTKDVWYFEHSLPDNQKSYSRSKPISIQEFESEKSWWNNRNEQDNTWKVSIEDIKKRNYNLDISSPYFGENEQKYSTKEIILLMERSMQKVNELLTSIKFEIE